MNKRLNKVKEYMGENSFDSLLVTDRKNMRYLSSYTGEGYLVISNRSNYLVTDFRYTDQAKEQTADFEILDISSFKPRDVFGDYKLTGFENTSISFARYTAFKEIFNELRPVDSALLNMRAVKDEEEIGKISMAEHIGDMAFEHILKYIKPGVPERDIATEIEYFMKKNGAESLSFDTIVASGAHGAMPHAEPDGRPIENNAFLTMDFGCVYEGYCSDMTRTVCVGKASEKMKKIYNTVLKAQTTSLDLLMAGVRGSDAHLNAQRIIDESFEGSFGHGLGHGVGLDIHECPRLSLKSDDILKVNNVVTVEPGIYITGFGGVRIEDLVVIGDKNIINLTKSPKNLIEI